MFLLKWTGCFFLDLKMAHEQQKKSMEEEFEKLRLSLQVLYVLTLYAIMCCTVFFFSSLFFMMARVRVCFSVLCLGSGWYVDISEPLSTRPGQAFWRSTAQKHRWADSGTFLDILFCIVCGKWYLEKSSSPENSVFIYLFVFCVLHLKDYTLE